VTLQYQDTKPSEKSEKLELLPEHVSIHVCSTIYIVVCKRYVG